MKEKSICCYFPALVEPLQMYPENLGRENYR